jgi:hypothetical protein
MALNNAVAWMHGARGRVMILGRGGVEQLAEGHDAGPSRLTAGTDLDDQSWPGDGTDPGHRGQGHAPCPQRARDGTRLPVELP